MFAGEIMEVGHSQAEEEAPTILSFRLLALCGPQLSVLAIDREAQSFLTNKGHDDLLVSGCASYWSSAVAVYGALLPGNKPCRTARTKCGEVRRIYFGSLAS